MKLITRLIISTGFVSSSLFAAEPVKSAEPTKIVRDADQTDIFAIPLDEDESEEADEFGDQDNADKNKQNDSHKEEAKVQKAAH
jgi:hypothetical protein